MAEMQAVQSAPGSSMLYQGQSILQASSTTADPAHESGQASPPVSGSVHALLSDGCLPGLQPPSTHAQHSFWTSFLSEAKTATATNGAKPHANGSNGTGEEEGGKKAPPKSVGALGDSLPSPPMTSTAIGLLLESGEKVPAPLSMGAPMGSFFSNLFNSCPEGETSTNGHGKPTPPSSSSSLSAYLQDGKDDNKETADAKESKKKETSK